MILDPEVRLWNEKLKRFRKNEKKQTIALSIAAGNYDTEIIIDLINQTIEDFRVKYHKSSIGFENLAYLQSIENKCKRYLIRLCRNLFLFIIRKFTDFISMDLTMFWQYQVVMAPLPTLMYLALKGTFKGI